MFEWWHWIVGGLCLIILELFIPAFFIVWFGISAIVVGLLLLIAPGLPAAVQMLLWAGLSTGLVIFWFRYFKNRAAIALRNTPTTHVTGEVGVLISNLTPGGRSHVRFQKPVLGADVWECYADEHIPANERVRIVAVEGNFIKVENAK